MTNPDLSWLTARPIAHRGLHDLNGKCWENTQTAFERAAAGNYAIECDVVLTADGVPIVFHDHELTRLTGSEGKVFEMTARDICKLPVGGTADKVPRLADVLALVDGRVPLIVELKGKESHDDGMVPAVAATLDGYKGDAAIMSFDHHLIRQFSTEAPGIAGGLTAKGRDVPALEAHFSMLAHGISFVSYDVRAIPNRFVKHTRDQLGLPLITWTVRDRQMAELTWREQGQITFEGFEPEQPK